MIDTEYYLRTLTLEKLKDYIQNKIEMNIVCGDVEYNFKEFTKIPPFASNLLFETSDLAISLRTGTIKSIVENYVSENPLVEEIGYSFHDKVYRGTFHYFGDKLARLPLVLALSIFSTSNIRISRGLENSFLLTDYPERRMLIRVKECSDACAKQLYERFLEPSIREKVSELLCAGPISTIKYIKENIKSFESTDNFTLSLNGGEIYSAVINSEKYLFYKVKDWTVEHASYLVADSKMNLLDDKQKDLIIQIMHITKAEVQLG